MEGGGCHTFGPPTVTLFDRRGHDKALNAPSYLLSIREDIKGMPSTIVLGEAAVVPQTGAWATLPLANVPLTTGKVYHLVLEWDVSRGQA